MLAVGDDIFAQHSIVNWSAFACAGPSRAHTGALLIDGGAVRFTLLGGST
jgi:hypothetical protein